MTSEIEINISDRYLIVPSRIFWLRTQKSAPISFILDTGATLTSLSEADMKKMSVELNDLRHSQLAIRGVGGKPSQVFEMDDVMVLFPCSNKPGKVYEHHLENLTVMQNPEMKENHKTTGKGIKFVRQNDCILPSLLGIDFFKDTGATINIDFKINMGKIIIDD